MTGGGLGYPAALEAALKLKEMALVHAEGAEAWEMTSGAATMLGPDAVVIAPRARGAGPRGARGPARARRGVGRPDRSRWAGARSSRRPPCCRSRRRTAEEHAPLSAVPPVALLAFALARLRGANPDHPGWIERYHSQGLTHILVGGGEASS